MKIEKFQLQGNNSVCAGAFQLLRCRAPAQLGGNIPDWTSKLTQIQHIEKDAILYFLTAALPKV
jgi:hypothetical protein